jgi:DNA-binding MarR family transcriptional regulator
LTRDDHRSLRLWLRLLTCTSLLEAQMRRLLQARFATSLPRFDLMAQLERMPDGLKMNELSRRLMVTGGNVTGLTDMLEAEGLVARAPDPADRRAQRVRLTRDGRRVFRAMAQEHERWIVRVFDVLSERDQAQLAELLGRVKTHAAELDSEGS